jgi:ribosome-associated protein
MDTGSIGAFAAYFVICSTESARQTNAVAEEVIHLLKQENEYPLHKEGEADSGWVIVDYGDVVLHIFSPEERDLYRLEEVWKEAKTILRMD